MDILIVLHLSPGYFVFCKLYLYLKNTILKIVILYSAAVSVIWSRYQSAVCDWKPTRTC